MDSQQPDKDTLERIAEIAELTDRTPTQSKLIDAERKSKGRTNKWLMAMLITETIAVIAFILVLFLNYNILPKTKNSKSINIYTICNKDIVNEYKNRYSSLVKAGDFKESSKEKIDGQIFDKISKLPNAEKDPNCLVIMYELSFSRNDKDSMKRCIDKINELSNEGKNPSVDFGGSYNKESLERDIKGMETMRRLREKYKNVHRDTG